MPETQTKNVRSIILLGWIIRIIGAFSSQNGSQDTMGFMFELLKGTILTVEIYFQ